MRKLFFVFLVFPIVLFSQSEENNSYLGVFIKGNFVYNGIEVGMQNYVKEHIDVISSIKIDHYNLGKLQEIEGVLGFKQMLLKQQVLISTKTLGFFYAPYITIGKAYFDALNPPTAQGYFHTKCNALGTGTDVGWTWNIIKYIRFTTGIGLGVNYYHLKNDELGNYEMNMIINQPLMFNKYYKLDTSVQFAIVFSKSFEKKQK